MGLMLHCGADPVSREELFSLPQPNAMTDTHFPIPHKELVEQVERGFGRLGKYEITSQEFGISHEQGNMFALLSLQSCSPQTLPPACSPKTAPRSNNWEMLVGLRNSHIQHFSAGLACGSRAFVCDNLAFSGDVVVGRKHTRNIMNELPQLIDDALYQLSDKMDLLAGRYDHYAGFKVNEKKMHDLVCRALDVNRDGRQYVIRGTHVPKVLKEWYEPRHEEFKPRNAWSAFNAFTEITKGIQLQEQSRRTQSLHNLFDQETKAVETLMPTLVN